MTNAQISLAGRLNVWQAALAPVSARFVTLLFLLALAARLLNIWVLSGDPQMFQVEDSGEYLRGRDAWIERGSFSGYLDGAAILPFERMPGYFWFLSGVSRIFGTSVVAIAAVQAVIDSTTVVLIAFLAAGLWAPSGRVAGLASAVWPNLAIHSAIVVQEALFILFVVSWMIAMACFARRPLIRTAALAGLLFGAALFFRSALQFMLMVMPLVIVFLVARKPENGRWLPGIAAAIVFFCAALVPISPVLYRNLSNFGASALTAQTGLHALFWTLSLVRMDQNGTTFDVEAKKTRTMFDARLKRAGIDPRKLDPFELDRIRQKVAMEGLLSVPVTRLIKVWIQGAIINLFSPSVLSHGRVRALPRPSFYQTPGKNLIDRARRYLFDDFVWFQSIVIAALLASIFSIVFQLLGLWRVFRLSRLAFFGIFVYVAYFLALSGPTAGPKYRMPYEPLLIILFAIGLTVLLQRIVKMRGAREGAPRGV